MTKEDAINIVQGARQYLTAGNPIWDAKKIDEAMSMAISALSEPIWDENREIILGVATFDELMDSERTGEWEVLSPAIIYKCSECGQIVKTRNIKAYKFCHGCGADMRGEQDG